MISGAGLTRQGRGSIIRIMHLTVNGRSRQLEVAPDATLLSLLRDHLHLTGAKPACERGECGACTVLITGADGALEPIYSCLALALAHEGDSITTIEGLAAGASMHPVQAAFIEHDAVQCGFCTPGQVLAAVSLLAHDADPSDDAIVRAMSGNLCRCGTYPKIVRAIHSAAETMRGSSGD
jgi:xanthine dehydrogenase YagT iron-sulfur-binding subunit